MLSIIANDPNQNIVNAPTPEIGMGVTEYHFADHYPYTVVKVHGAKSIDVQADNYYADPESTKGVGHQDWIIEPNPNGYIFTITLRKDGKWRRKGESIKSPAFIVGKRSHYHCWEF